MTILKRWLGIACLTLWLSFLVVISSASHPVSPPETKTFEAIDQFVQSEMQTLHIPGLALGIVEGDRPVYLRGYGIADPSQRPVTAQTPFFIYSLSKSFTAIAIMQLVEAGKLNLDTSVQHYLPWFRTNDVQASAQITIRDLLYHTSGFPTATGLETFYDGDFGDRALEHNVRRLHDTPLANPVGETFQYSNINYDILGLLVQTLSGQPFEDYVQQQILAPLEMRHSFLSPELVADLARGYSPFLGLTIPYHLTPSRSIQASAGIISTAEDMTHALIAHLNDGHYGNAVLLSPSGMANLYQPGIETPENDYGEFYAMGWYVTSSTCSKQQSNANPQQLSELNHPGGGTGFHSSMRLIPDRALGVVVLMNTQDLLIAPRYNHLGVGIMQLLQGQLPIAPTNDALGRILRLILLGIVLFQMIRSCRAVRCLRLWKQQLRVHSALPKEIIRHSMTALAIDAVVVLVVFVAPHLQGGIPWLFLLRAIPDVSILIGLIALLTIGLGTVRTALTWKILHSYHS